MVGSVVTCGLVAILTSRVASPLTPPLVAGAGAPRALESLSEVLGFAAISRDTAAALAAGLMLASVAAFLYALRLAWQRQLGLTRVVMVAVALHVLAIASPLFVSRDVYSYAMYGRMVSIHDVNPYVEIPASFAHDPVYPFVSVDWIDSPSVYGPGFSAVAAGVTRVSRSPAATVQTFRGLAALAGLATMALTVVAARRILPERVEFAAVLAGWNPVLLFHSVGGGHNDVLVGLALAAAVVLILHNRILWATAVLSLGVLVKISAVVPLAMLVLASTLSSTPHQRLRQFGKHAGVGLAVALPFILPFIQSENPTFGSLKLIGRLNHLSPYGSVLVLARGAGRSLGGDLGGDVASALIRVAFPVLLVTVFVRLSRHVACGREAHEPPVVVGAMAWATLIALLLSPLLYPWYVAWLVPLVWILPSPARLGAVALSAALTVSELVADPSRSPDIGEAMALSLHRIEKVVAFGVLVWLLLDLRRRLRVGRSADSRDPLLADRSNGDERRHLAWQPAKARG